MKKPLLRTASLAFAATVLVLLLAVWVDSCWWRTRIQIHRPTWTECVQVEAVHGLIHVRWNRSPEWDKSTHGLPPTAPFTWQRSYMHGSVPFCDLRIWVPDLFGWHEGKISSGSHAAGGPTTWRHGILYQYYLFIPVWMLVTLHLALCWLVLGIRQYRRRKQWQHRQLEAANTAAADAATSV